MADEETKTSGAKDSPGGTASSSVTTPSATGKDDAGKGQKVVPKTPPPPAAGQGEDSQDQPENPEAFYKAQAEKFERLFKKAEAQNQTLESQIQTMEEKQQEAFRQQLDSWKSELDAEMEALKAEAEGERLGRLRAEAMAVAGWAPEDIAELGEFITGETPEEIQAQVEKLSTRLTRPAATTRARLGNAGGKTGHDASFIRDYLKKGGVAGPFGRIED